VSDYAARIRAARAYANKTQDELAEALGVDAQTIKRRESGKQEPKKAERIAIAAVTGVPLLFIEGGWEALSPPTDEEISRAAALVREALLGAAQASGLALAVDAEQTGGQDPGDPNAAGGSA
jgi:transcriptional regulator with XRE-family HTH domain